MENKIKQLTIAAMCLSIGIIMPQALHAIPNAGNMFLPMHLPTMLCGFICGPVYGMVVGVLSPLLSHFIFSMPSALMLGQMIVELGVYGLVIGLLNKKINIKKRTIKQYVVLLLAMLAGRIAYGILNALIFRFGEYSLSIWLTAAFVTGLPGIIVQLIFVPLLVDTTRRLLNE